jgi:hypothetical protein
MIGGPWFQLQRHVMSAKKAITAAMASVDGVGL